MSEQHPIFGVDLHPVYQHAFDFDKARRDGYRYCFIKASEGPYRDGSVLRMPGLEPFVRRAEDAGFDVGLYAFLVESFPDSPSKSGRANAEHYLRVCERLGGLDNRLLVADFEEYAEPWPYLSPTNGCLYAFNDYVMDRVKRPLMVYSTHHYWESVGKPSGDLLDYGTNLSWDAELASIHPVARPKDYYYQMWDWGWEHRVWGGITPSFWQFTWAGRVGGINVDVDACRLSETGYRNLWR